MDDVIGHALVLVADPSLVAHLHVLAGVALVTTEEVHDAAAHLARLGARAALVRPDSSVFSTAETAKELADLFAALPLSPVNLPEPEMA